MMPIYSPTPSEKIHGTEKFSRSSVGQTPGVEGIEFLWFCREVLSTSMLWPLALHFFGALQQRPTFDTHAWEAYAGHETIEVKSVK